MDHATNGSNPDEDCRIKNEYPQIETLQTQTQKQRSPLRTGINKNNLIELTYTEKEKTDWTGLAVINARSVSNKSDYLKLYIQEKNINICCISETWLKSSNPGNQWECKHIITQTELEKKEVECQLCANLATNLNILLTHHTTALNMSCFN